MKLAAMQIAEKKVWDYGDSAFNLTPGLRWDYGDGALDYGDSAFNFTPPPA